MTGEHSATQREQSELQYLARVMAEAEHFLWIQSWDAALRLYHELSAFFLSKGKLALAQTFQLRCVGIARESHGTAELAGVLREMGERKEQSSARARGI